MINKEILLTVQLSSSYYYYYYRCLVNNVSTVQLNRPSTVSSDHIQLSSIQEYELLQSRLMYSTAGLFFDILNESEKLLHTSNSKVKRLL